MGNFGSKAKKTKDSSNSKKPRSPKRSLSSLSSLSSSPSHVSSISSHAGNGINWSSTITGNTIVVTSNHSSSTNHSSSSKPRPKSRPQPLPDIITDERAIDAFELLKTLGTGCYGRVVLARHRATGAFVAIKILKKTDIIRKRQVDHVKDELRVLKAVQSCRHVVQLLTSFQDARNLYLVMEYVTGGELFVHLRRSLRFQDEVVRFYAAEVVLTWDHLHSQNMIHRDLKPENLLLTHDGHIKLTDFGFAKQLKEGVAWTVCGTPEYLAPEMILSKGYGKAADWWALGVLLYEMLTGFSPFSDEDPYQVHEKILSGKIEYPSYLKPNAIDLISKLLTADLTHRLGNLKNGSEDIKRHPFFAGIDWEAMARGAQVPPFAPGFKGEGDSTFFLKYPEDPDLLPSLHERDLYSGLFPDF